MVNILLAVVGRVAGAAGRAAGGAATTVGKIGGAAGRAGGTAGKASGRASLKKQVGAAALDSMFGGEEENPMKNMIKRLAGLKKRGIYVGIPQEETSRNNEDVTNAELLFIHTNGARRRSMIKEMDATMDSGKPYSKAYELYIQSHGSPLWQSPPRPVIEPAIAAHAKEIAEGFKGIYAAAATGNAQAEDRAIARTGMIAQNAARGWFTDPRNGWAANAPSTIKQKGSDKPLIDTGAMRKAIVYVVRSR